MSDVTFIAAPMGHAPDVTGASLLRTGGVSKGKYASLNLATHVGDDPQDVATNRLRVQTQLGLPSQPVWLDQCHGTQVAVLDDETPSQPVPETDAAVTRVPGRVLAVLTADCLPVLFSSRAAGVIGVAHAGWRGLAAGVLENTLAALGVAPDSVSVWLGPAIGASAFEVGEEVRAAFVDQDAGVAGCFVAAGAGKWLARSRRACALQAGRGRA